MSDKKLLWQFYVIKLVNPTECQGGYIYTNILILDTSSALENHLKLKTRFLIYVMTRLIGDNMFFHEYYFFSFFFVKIFSRCQYNLNFWYFCSKQFNFTFVVHIFSHQ